MMRIFTILLLASTMGSAVEWGDRAEGELRWGEALSIGGYSLVAADFTPEEVTPRMVMLKLSRGGEPIATRALGSGESFSVDDEVMVVAQEVWMRDRLIDGLVEPRARVALLVHAVPELRVLVISQEDSFEVGEAVRLQVEIENVGAAEAEEVVVEVTTDPPIFSSIHKRSSLAPGEAWDGDPETGEVDPIKVRFAAPSTSGPEEVSIKVSARYRDGDGGVYESWGGTSFRIFGPLKLYKYAEEAMKLKDKSIVRLSVSNRGDRTLAVDLSDSVGGDFQAEPALKWKISVPPGEMETASYSIRAKKPGEGQVLPPAEATYSIDGVTHRVASRNPVIDVIGPLVEVEKKASASTVQVGEMVTVTLAATNVGNRRTMVSAKETVPSWGRLVSGETDLSSLLLPGETATLVYTISCPAAGSFEIPAATVCYRDEDGTACTVESSRLRITVQEVEKADPKTSPDTPEMAPLPIDGSTSEVGDGGGGQGLYDGADGESQDSRRRKAPGSGPILWALPALILIIFVAFDRYI
jgi:hypothetical protein